MTDKKKLVPTLRFSEFKGKWQTKKFGDTFSFYQTNSFSRSLLNYKKGIVKNIHYGDIHTKFNTNFYIYKENVPFINEEIDLKKIAPDCYCKEGDLVIADASEDYKDVGKAIELIKLNNQKLLAGLHTYIARDTENTTALGFKGYLMQIRNVRLQIMKFATGISVLGISKGNLSKVQINLPSLPEQQKIASFLTAIDNRIRQLTQKVELLELYKKGVMQQIFSQTIRFTGEKEKIFPDWKVKKLGEIAKITTGSSNRQDSGLDGEYTFFDRSQDIRTSNIFLFDGEAIIVAGEGQEFIPKYFIGKFDLHQRTYAIMNLKDSNGKFIFYSIAFHRNYFLSQAVGSTVKSLRLPMFQKMRIKLPSLPEQQKIANFLTAIDEKISFSKEQLDKMQTYKKGLLQQMFV